MRKSAAAMQLDAERAPRAAGRLTARPATARRGRRTENLNLGRLSAYSKSRLAQPSDLSSPRFHYDGAVANLEFDCALRIATLRLVRAVSAAFGGCSVPLIPEVALRGALVLCIAGTAPGASRAAPADEAPVRIYRAAKIITMNPDQPSASAVAVQRDVIVAVGSVESIREELDGHSILLDDTFETKIVLPGFIEPHMHTRTASMLLPMEFITSRGWTVAGEPARAVRGREAFLARLREFAASDMGSREWIDTWGYDPSVHGEITRQDLDAISTSRPILVWHESLDEIHLNTRGLERMGITAENVDSNPNVSYERGHFRSAGLDVVMPSLIRRLLTRENHVDALRTARALIHAGGVTTIADAGFASLGFDQEFRALLDAGYDADTTPFRTVLMIDGRVVGEHMSHDVTRGWIESLPKRGTHRIKLRGDAVMLFADGPARSRRMQMKNGQAADTQGIWLMEPPSLEAAARVYWRAGLQLHINVNGDLALESVLDLLEKLQTEAPRDDHRSTLHQFGYASLDQIARLAAIRGSVSLNPLHAPLPLEANASTDSSGGAPTRRIPAGSVVAAGLPLSLHSGFAQAPLKPLQLVASAVTRSPGPEGAADTDERIALHEALAAITRNAAFQLRMEDRIGTIEAGKLADFTILERDPYDVLPVELPEIRLWGTVFEGKLYPLSVSR